MKIFYTIREINRYLTTVRKKNYTIGFIPTMGALHKGHISLIKKSKEENDITVCSIFVNPIQFNNKSDFEKYPINTEKDIKMLESEKCDVLFRPSYIEMYPAEITEKYDFGLLESVMEGKHRLGHFNGVAIVVKRLFDIINPHYAYFGEKDFQQLMIIKKLVTNCKLPIKIIPCPIVREDDGLAMSSRNERLTIEQRKISSEIYRILKESAEKYKTIPLKNIKQWVEDEVTKINQFKLEYFEIADSVTLQSITDYTDGKKIMGFIVVNVGDIRLIDNIKYF